MTNRKTKTLNISLAEVKTKIYDKCFLQMSEINNEHEGTEYDACNFELNGMNIICRSSKITPKKVGQFVTFWKRNNKGVTEPFNENEAVDFYVINVRTEDHFGQFVFPKFELINKGIISTNKKEGKRGFRIYPKWDRTENKQAEKTQQWQLKYFYEINHLTNLSFVKNLYTENQ